MKPRPRTALPNFRSSFAHGSRPSLAFAVAAIAAASLSAIAQTPLSHPASSLINPRAIAFNPTTGKVYAVHTSDDAVEVYIDKLQQHHLVHVGASPISLAVNAATGNVYVANAGNGTVTVLDGKSDAAIATIPVGSHPYSIAVNSVTNKVYVTHTFGDQLTILDGATNIATDLKTGSSDLIAIDARTNTIHLLGYGGPVKDLDGATGKLTEKPVGKHAWALTLDEATGAVYVARIENSDVAALHSGSAEPAILPAGAIPCAIAVNSKSGFLYVANYGDNSVTMIDTKAGRAIATVPVGDHPESVAYDPARNLVFVANTRSKNITVIDAASHAVLATLPAGNSPYALAVVPDSDSLYVANESADASTLVDLKSLRKSAQ